METETKSTSLPPISKLFEESWQVFSKSVLSLFILTVISLVIYLILAILAFVLFVISGTGSTLLQQGVEGFIAQITATPALIWVLVIIGFIAWLIFLVINSAFQIAFILILDSNGSIPIGTALKNSLGLIIPLFLVGLLMSFLSFGAFFVFIIPAILFYFLFIFSQFEVVLNNQTGIPALKRSLLIVSSHFGAIVLRLVVIFVAYFIIASIIPSLLSQINTEVEIIVTIISFIINTLLGWYLLAYFITLYKQAKTSTKKDQTSILWMWIVSLLGWVIAIGLIYGGWQLVSSGVLNNLNNNPALNTKVSLQNALDEMSPEVKVHFDRSSELFAQMRQNQTNQEAVTKLNNENIAELKKALELSPNNPKIWYELGNANTWVSTTGSLEEGLSAFEKAAELDPENIIYINGVGDMLIQMERYEEAVLQFQKTLRLTENSGLGNLSLGIAYKRLKITDSAKIHLEKAIEILSKNNTNGNFDSRILQAQKELSELPQ